MGGNEHRVAAGESGFLTLGEAGLIEDPFNGTSFRAPFKTIVPATYESSASAHAFDPKLGHFRNLWISD
jgi:hypothetical protein